MRHYIIASHRKLAHGLKDTLGFITQLPENVHEISAYVDDNVTVEDQIKQCFARIRQEDEVVIMTDIMGGSVNQKFYPFTNDHVHLIAGVNLPLALSLLLQPEDIPFSKETIEAAIEESKSCMVYVNQYDNGVGEDDE